MKRLATWVESTRSVGEWKLPTLSAREWRSAAAEALGANGSCTCTMSNGVRDKSVSIARVASSGSATRPPRRAGVAIVCIGARTRTAPGSNSEAGSDAAARIRRRDSRTCARDPLAASTTTP